MDVVTIVPGFDALPGESSLAHPESDHADLVVYDYADGTRLVVGTSPPERFTVATGVEWVLLAADVVRPDDRYPLTIYVRPDDWEAATAAAVPGEPVTVPAGRWFI